MNSTHCLIDIGANLTHPELNKKIDVIVDNIKSANIEKVIITSSNIQDTKEALKIINKYPDLFYTTVGFHPHNAKDYSSNYVAEIETLLNNKKVLALGECGLDFYRKYSTKEEQIFCFEQHLEIANTIKKPVFLHERHAFKDFSNILNKYKDGLCKYVVHCFTGTKEELKKYIDMGCYIGITGWITDESRGKHLHEIIKYIPEDRLMIETDSPYLIPHNINSKHDGINEPSYLTYVAETIAKCLNKDINYVKDITLRNTKLFFNINE
jgi:TatD DNase family protein